MHPTISLIHFNIELTVHILASCSDILLLILRVDWKVSVMEYLCILCVRRLLHVLSCL